jgi:hypothetical protein
MTAPAAQALRPVATAAEAEQLVAHLTEAMDSLRQVVQEETDLIAAGRIETATRLEKSKSDLARVYAADVSRFKISHAFLMRTVPGSLAALRERHDNFRSLLELNHRVLATAHLVSEGIIRGVAGELARKAAPQTYGASGRAVPTPKTSFQPLALSRTL